MLSAPAGTKRSQAQPEDSDLDFSAYQFADADLRSTEKAIKCRPMKPGILADASNSIAAGSHLKVDGAKRRKV